MEYSINGGTSWQLSNLFSGLARNSYQAIVRDQSLCTTLWGHPIAITEPARLRITGIQISAESGTGAANGSLIFTAAGGTIPYNYTLTPGALVNQTGIFNNLSGNTYSVSITDLNGCVVDSTGIFLGVTNIDIPTVDRGFIVYPNPSSGHFFIELNNQFQKELFINIYNSLGKLVFSDKVSSTEIFVKKEINLTNESKGIFILQIKGHETPLLKKLLIR